MSTKLLVGATALASSLAIVPAAGADEMFSNPAPITINDAVTPNVPVPATPYPSTVSVPSLTFRFGSLAATVTLNGVSHTSPADIKVVLVNPLGATTLLENVGGTTSPVTNATLRFKGLTGSPASFAGPLVPSTFGPSAYTTAGVAVAQNTAPFKYTSGNWDLYVSDQDPGDTGSIAGGFSVTIAGLLGTPRTPSNTIQFGHAKLDKRRGTAKLPVTVPHPGLIVLKNTKIVKGATLNAPAAGVYQLAIKSKGKALKRLRRKGKVDVNPTVTFTPAGGTSGTDTDWITLKLKKKHKK